MRLASAVLVLACLAFTHAHADRYRVSLDGLASTYVNDVRTFLAGVNPDPGITPRTEAAASLLTVPAPAAVAPVVIAPGADTSTAAATTLTPVREPGLTISGDELSAPPAGPMPADFAGRLASSYSINAPEDVQAIWGWYSREPAGLGDAEKLGNAVVRFVVAVDETPAGGSTAQPKKLKPDATSGTVRDAIALRSEPWGPSKGSVAAGTQLEVIPPAEGPWYRVRTGGGEGWVSGLWVELR